MNKTAFQLAQAKWHEADADLQRIVPTWPDSAPVSDRDAQQALQIRAAAEAAMRKALHMDDSAGHWDEHWEWQPSCSHPACTVP